MDVQGVDASSADAGSLRTMASSGTPACSFNSSGERKRSSSRSRT